MLNELLRLAKEPEEARSVLMQRVADVFLDGVGGHTEYELELFCDVLMRLLDVTDLQDRASLSRRIAPVPDTPQVLARRLAGDVILVAAPMLELSPCLNEDDIRDLATNMPADHLEAIARRANCSSEVADILVARGKTPVWRSLAANKRANISNWAKATLARHAIEDKILRGCIVERRDLTPAICMLLMPHVNRATYEKLGQIVNHHTPRFRPAEHSGRMPQRYNGGSLVKPAGDVHGMWASISQGETDFNKALTDLLDSDRLGDTIRLICLASGHPLNGSYSTLFTSSPDKLIKMACVAGTSRQNFEALSRARCRQMRIPENQAARWVSAFAKQQQQNHIANMTL